jgi:hypothetical protein
MRLNRGPPEGPGPNQALVDLFHQFEELCEVEGPGAADEEDLCRLRHEMTEACMAGNARRFLDRLAKAMSLRDGSGFGNSSSYSH